MTTSGRQRGAAARRAALGALLAASFPGAARADAGREAWLLRLELPVAKALTEPQRSGFGLGALPALAVARTLGPYVSVGAQLRAGALAEGAAPDRTRRDPGSGGWAGLLLAARVRPFAAAAAATRTAGPWVELAGGGGVTGSRPRPAFEIGLGWEIPLRRLAVGPFVRYLHIVEPSSSLDPEDARLGLAGIAVTFFDPKAPPPPPPEEPPAPSLPATPPAPVDGDGDGLADAQDACPREPEDRDGFRDEDGCPDPDDDGDGILDAADKCPREAEVVNGVADDDGCPDEGVIELVEDRIVLEERVLFDKNFARVKSAGRVVLAAVMTLWKQHPEWERLQIEGHADETGGAAFNQRLSERRAARVRDALVALGAAPDRIAVEGFGNTRPLVPGRDEAALQKNRRVEIVVVRKTPAPPASGARSGAPLAPPALENDETRRTP